MGDKADELRVAAKKGDVAAVQKLLSDGATQSPDESGDTPLLLVTRNYITAPKYVEVVRVLLEDGCDVNFKNNDGNNAVYNAALNGNLEIMELLLEYGADLEMEGMSNMVPLGVAATKKHHAVVNVIIDKLIEQGKFSNKQVEWINNSESELQQLQTFRAITGILKNKQVLIEFLKHGLIDAITSGMKKYSKKSLQTTGLQLLQQAISTSEGVSIAKEKNVKEIIAESCEEHADDGVIQHLLQDVSEKL